MSAQKKNWVTGVIALGVICLVGITILVFKSQPFSGLDTFPVGSYRSSPANLTGNQYYLEAQIDSMILADEDKGRLFAVIPAGESNRLLVFVPFSLEKNIHKDQRYRMGVAVMDGGLIYVNALEKY